MINRIRIRFTETEAAGMYLFSRGLLAGSLVAILVSLLFRALYLRKRKIAGKAGNMPSLDMFVSKLRKKLPVYSQQIEVGDLHSAILPDKNDWAGGAGDMEWF